MKTSRIRLGCGVINAPLHHPFMVAERASLLDHLTHGRAMLALGSGALPTDAYMLGVDTVSVAVELSRGGGRGGVPIQAGVW